MATQTENMMSVDPSQSLTSAMKATNKRSTSRKVTINAGDSSKGLQATSKTETAKMEATNVTL